MIHPRRHIFSLANLSFLVAVMAILGAFLMLREKDVATEADGLAAAAGRSVETNRVLSRALLPESAANDLFAATDGQPAADHAAAADIAAKFRLVGVMLSGVSGPRRPMAIVEIRSDGHQKRLHEGDELEPHVRGA